MAGIVTSRDAARINRAIRRSEGLAVNDPARTLGPQFVGVRAAEPNTQTIKVTSATPTAGLYPCEVAVRDAAGAAWELLGATVWAYDRNGAALVNGVYYDGEQVGNYTDGEPVFLVDVGTASAGGLIPTPPTVTWNSNQNNYDPGTSSGIFVNTTATVDLTGVVAPGSNTARIITIYNLTTSTNPIIIRNESGSSTNINRIYTPGGLPYPILPGEKIELIYDPTTNDRWILPLPPKVLFPAATTGYPSLNIPHGTFPTSPVNGDVGTTTAGLYAQINGVTKGPFVSAADVGAGTAAYDFIADEVAPSSTPTVDNLNVVTFAANYLNANKDKIEFDYTLELKPDATSQSVSLSFDGANIFAATYAVPTVPAILRVWGWLVRVTSTTFRATVSHHADSNATPTGAVVQFTDGSTDFTATAVLQLEVVCGGVGDIVTKAATINRVYAGA